MWAAAATTVIRQRPKMNIKTEAGAMSNDYSHCFVYDTVHSAMRGRHAAMLCEEPGSSAPAQLWRVCTPRSHLKAFLKNIFIPNFPKIKVPINAGSYEISTQVMHAVNCRNIVFNRLGYSTRYTSTTPFAPSAVIAPELLVFIAFIAFIDLMEDTLLRTLA